MLFINNLNFFSNLRMMKSRKGLFPDYKQSTRSSIVMESLVVFTQKIFLKDVAESVEWT